MLLQGHKDPQLDKNIKLDTESFDRIITWIDINAPYYPEYASAYPKNQYGRSPLDPAQMKRLSELTGINLHDQKFASFVNFTRPELSACLAGFKDKGDPRYAEALSIVQSGKQMLAQQPRADMTGFRLTGTDLEREIKYTALVEDNAKPQKALGERKATNGGNAKPKPGSGR